MHIAIVHNSKIPVIAYGGIERVIWYLAQELVKMQHKVTFLVEGGSYCPFADIIVYDKSKPLNKQIPKSADFVHIHYQPNEKINLPYLITIHGNLPRSTLFYPNTNFVSKNHAKRYNANAFVYNGLSWDDYGKPDLTNERKYLHFLGKAAWRVKNVKDAIEIAKKNKTEIKILGGHRFNVKMGLRFTTTKYASFYGMAGAEKKIEILNHSRGLVFPVLWHEPFGLAIIESLYFGCPVIGTKYGALPELITSDFGYLSNSQDELITAIQNLQNFSRKSCHEYAYDKFNSVTMAKNYLELYERILNDEKINNEIPQLNSAENKLEPYIK